MPKRSTPREHKTSWNIAAWYPDKHECFNDWQWRWEFLRRADFYQEAWNAGKETDDELWRVPSPEHKEIAEQLFRLYLLPDPDSRINSKTSIFKNVTSQGGLLFEGLYSEVPEKIIERLAVPPEKQAAFLLSMLKSQLLKNDLARSGKIALAQFNLSSPIKPQLKLVEHLLNESQRHHHGVVASKKLNGDRRKLWPLYLRCLDAVSDGVRPMDIFRQFVDEGVPELANAANEASKIEGWINAAQEVQEKVIFYL